MALPGHSVELESVDLLHSARHALTFCCLSSADGT
jgi:hypothetical protein